MLLKNKIDKLKSELKNDNVLTSLEERYCYAKDALNIKSKTKTPDLVVFVESIEDVQKIVRFAYEHEIPIVARGAGTNMVGACLCPKGGIVLNFSKMNKILDINLTDMSVKVQPGVVLGDLKTEVEALGLFYPPDPSNYRVSTVGGSIAQSSGGAKSFKYGTTKDYVLSLKVVTSDGKLITLGSNTTKESFGYHLSQLMVGSEGTLGIVVEATLKLIPKPETSKLVLAYFSSVATAVSAIDSIISANIFPASIDFMDNNSINTVNSFLPCGLDVSKECVLLIDLDGLESTILSQVEKLKKALSFASVDDIFIPETYEQAELINRARRSSYAAATRLAPDVISDDIIVPRSNLVKMIKKCNEVAKFYNLNLCIVGHVGDGNLHPQFVLDINDEEAFRNYNSAKSEIYDTVINLGGTISAEHGVGLEKIPYLENTIDRSTLEYMKMIKNVFDPKNILNPGKIFKI